MKHQLPLKWSLTVSMLVVWIFIVLVFMLVFQNLISRINERLEDTMARHQLADAAAIATSVEFEVAAKDEALLAEKIKQYSKANDEIQSISVLNTDKTVLYTTGRKEDTKNILEKLGEGLNLRQSIIEEPMLEWDRRLLSREIIFPH